MTKSTECMYELFSRKDSVVEHAPEWKAWYIRTIKCSICGWPDPKKFTRPTGVDVVVRRMPSGSVALAGGFPRLMIQELHDLLAPYCRHVFVGRCYVQTKPEDDPIESPYVTLYTPPGYALEAHRGKYCRHRTCKGCGMILNQVFWASGAVLRRDLNERGVYQDVLGRVYIRSLLAESLKLQRKFPDLKLYRVSIFDEPHDGDTLPGDPGWTGKLKNRRFPIPPERDPPKGRFTLG